MENILYDKRLLSEISEDIPEDDPFYSEENVQNILKAIEQIKRGQYVEFDIHDFIKAHNMG